MPTWPGNRARLIAALQGIVGLEAVLTDEADLSAYGSDAYMLMHATPDIVILPVHTAQVAASVRACRAHGAPFVARGAGTVLSGGATAINGGVIISLAQMNRVLEVDAPARRAVVQAGCPNIRISEAAACFDLHYAPDPSSQFVSTIGGNIAENAGGPHTLKYGVTTNHLLSATVVLADGTVIETDSASSECGGYDVLGLLAGSEGTLGIVTEAVVRLVPNPPARRTMLAVFDSADACTSAVTRLLTSGLLPCALEMIDRAILVAVEDAFKFGFPRDAAAVLIVELDGYEIGLDDEAAIAGGILMEQGAREVRLAATEQERANLWIARKKAVGVIGRLARSTVTQDGAIPRSKLPTVLAGVAEIAARYGIRICNVFHAGDGNLHPCVLFNAQDPDELTRVEAANHEILGLCLSVGGSISGEHGVGIEKLGSMARMFAEPELSAMRAVRAAFDPDGYCNPGKLIPVAAGETA